MWNPYVPTKPVALLRGHNAPIFYLFIAPEENRIFSISTDKCVKVSVSYLHITYINHYFKIIMRGTEISKSGSNWLQGCGIIGAFASSVFRERNGNQKPVRERNRIAQFKQVSFTFGHERMRTELCDRK